MENSVRNSCSCSEFPASYIEFRQDWRSSSCSALISSTYWQALNSKNDREGQYYKEAMLLQAKTCYIQGKFQECLDILEQVREMNSSCWTLNLAFEYI